MVFFWKKMKNKISQDYSFDERFYAVLITSQLPDYQLAWSLNNHLKIDFRKLPELLVFHSEQGKQLPYTLYGWRSSNDIGYFLVTSLEKSAPLSVKTFLLIEKRERRETMEHFIEKAAASDFIFSIEEVSFNKPKTPKQKQLVEHLTNIVIDMESHLDKLEKKHEYVPPKKDIPL